MTTARTLAFILLTLLLFAAGCSRNVVGGSPRAAPSTSSGTSVIVEATLQEVNVATTNAFPEPNWVLEPAAESGYLVRGWHATNGLVLFSIDQTITNVQLSDPAGTWVPYVAYFHITAAPAGEGKTTLAVRTIRSEVIDGQEPGVHGGWAQHRRAVPPIRKEEEWVLVQIQGKLQTKPASR